MRSIANGFVSPGVLNATVELPIRNSGKDTYKVNALADSINNVDEDAFLSDENMNGISIHELIANVHQVTNGALGSSKISRFPLLKKKDSFLFDGDFSVTRGYSGNDQIQIQSVNPANPSVSMTLRSSKGKEGAKDNVVDMARRVSSFQIDSAVKKNLSARAKFVDTRLGGVISQEKVDLMTEPHHVESMIAIAHNLPNLEVLSHLGLDKKPRNVSIPSFKSPSSLESLEYS